MKDQVRQRIAVMSFLLNIFGHAIYSGAEPMPASQFVANPSAGSIPETLTLKQAIDRAMASNPDLKESQLALRQSEIVYDDAWDTMYIPQINLYLTSSSAKNLGYLPGFAGSSVPSQGYPTSSALIGLGEYTLYNFGRDKLVFDQAKLTWQRAKQVFEELKRSIRFSVINAFWTLKSRQDKLEAYDRSIEVAAAVVRLHESRVFMKKANETDVSSSKVDLFFVKNLRNQAETDEKSALFSLNVLLGDEVGIDYKIVDQISFLPIKVTEEILYQTYESESPSIKNAQTELLKSQFALELAEKNRLPLPIVKFTGLTVGYGNSFYGGKSESYTSAVGQKNIDISAGINLTIPLTGPGGIFGTRMVEYYQLSRDSSELKIRTVANRDRQTIYQYVQSIRQGELSVINNRQSYKDSMNVLQNVLQRFMSRETISRLEITDAVRVARDTEIYLNDAILLHLYYKTLLAAFIGVDYLPRME